MSSITSTGQKTGCANCSLHVWTPDEIAPSAGQRALKPSPRTAISVAVLILRESCPADRPKTLALRSMTAFWVRGLHDLQAQVERCSLDVPSVLDHTTCSWLNRPRGPRRRPTRAPEQAVLHHLLRAQAPQGTLRALGLGLPTLMDMLDPRCGLHQRTRRRVRVSAQAVDSVWPFVPTKCPG